jgi:hypothetical protein
MRVGVSRGRRYRLAAFFVLVAVFLVLVWGGYDVGWTWTGLSSKVTLWDWLEALALPVTVGLVPLLLRHRRRIHRRHKAVAQVLLLGFAALVLAGYLVPLPWTGFTGNTLWDWLSLALLPLVIATATLWPPPERLTPAHLTVIAVWTTAAVLIVVAGYVVPWAWTGFTGNTVWDWVKLLLLPVLVPTVLLPRLVAFFESRYGAPH